MSKHTPGPWTALHYGERPQSVSAVNGAVSVCSFGATLYGQNREQAQANARLIAAAPELLRVAEQVYVILGDITHEWKGRNTIHGQSVLANLCDAIAKATGRDNQDVQDDYCNRTALSRAQGDA